MKLFTYKGHELHLPTSGGKAGQGYNLTSTIQVRRDSCIVKQFRFKMGRKEVAIERAKRFIDNITTEAK